MTKHLKLTLTDEEGIILDAWTIGEKVEYDIEDLDIEPEHNYYTDPRHTDYSVVGKDIMFEAEKYFNCN